MYPTSAAMLLTRAAGTVMYPTSAAMLLTRAAGTAYVLEFLTLYKFSHLSFIIHIELKCLSR